jgi:Lipopolysaccharide kinase (Kdo/WaaP) family
VADSLLQRLRTGAWRIRQDPDWAEFAGPLWIDRIMSIPVTDRFHSKQGRSIGRWTLRAGGRKLVVYLKRHYQLPRRHGILAVLFPGRDWSPAMQEERHLVWARQQGLPVPRVLAAGERIGPWGRLQSFIAVAELDDMLPLHEAIPLARARLEGLRFQNWKRALAKEMASLSHALHDRSHFHKDLYLCHFYVPREATGTVPQSLAGLLHLIDLHRLARHRWTWPWWQAKDLSQLLYSSETGEVDVRDRVCFWRAYLAAAGKPKSLRMLGRWIRFKAARYRQHNRRRAAVAGRAA